MIGGISLKNGNSMMSNVLCHLACKAKDVIFSSALLHMNTTEFYQLVENSKVIIGTIILYNRDGGERATQYITLLTIYYQYNMYFS